MQLHERSHTAYEKALGLIRTPASKHIWLFDFLSRLKMHMDHRTGQLQMLKERRKDNQKKVEGVMEDPTQKN